MGGKYVDKYVDKMQLPNYYVGGWSVWLDEKRSQPFEDWNLLEKCLDGVETGVPIRLFNGEEDVTENEDEGRNEENDL